MPRYRVTFDRLGRTRPEPQVFEASDPGNPLAEAIFRFARGRLASQDYTVETYSDGTGSIDGGRFGAFTWEAE